MQRGKDFIEGPLRPEIAPKRSMGPRCAHAQGPRIHGRPRPPINIVNIFNEAPER